MERSQIFTYLRENNFQTVEELSDSELKIAMGVLQYRDVTDKLLPVLIKENRGQSLIDCYEFVSSISERDFWNKFSNENINSLSNETIVALAGKASRMGITDFVRAIWSRIPDRQNDLLLPLAEETRILDDIFSYGYYEHKDVELALETLQVLERRTEEKTFFKLWERLSDECKKDNSYLFFQSGNKEILERMEIPNITKEQMEAIMDSIEVWGAESDRRVLIYWDALDEEKQLQYYSVFEKKMSNVSRLFSNAKFDINSPQTMDSFLENINSETTTVNIWGYLDISLKRELFEKFSKNITSERGKAQFFCTLPNGVFEYDSEIEKENEEITSQINRNRELIKDYLLDENNLVIDNSFFEDFVLKYVDELDVEPTINLLNKRTNNSFGFRYTLKKFQEKFEDDDLIENMGLLFESISSEDIIDTWKTFYPTVKKATIDTLFEYGINKGAYWGINRLFENEDIENIKLIINKCLNDDKFMEDTRREEKRLNELADYEAKAVVEQYDTRLTNFFDNKVNSYLYFNRVFGIGRMNNLASAILKLPVSERKEAVAEFINNSNISPDLKLAMASMVPKEQNDFDYKEFMLSELEKIGSASHVCIGVCWDHLSDEEKISTGKIVGMKLIEDLYEKWDIKYDEKGPYRTDEQFWVLGKILKDIPEQTKKENLSEFMEVFRQNSSKSRNFIIRRNGRIVGEESNTNAEVIKALYNSFDEKNQDSILLPIVNEIKDDKALLLSFLENIKPDKQIDSMIKIMEEVPDNDVKLFVWKEMASETYLDDSTLEKSLKLLLPELDDDKIKEKQSVMRLIEKYNQDCRATINLDMLSNDILNEYGLELIVKLSVYPELQEMFVNSVGDYNKNEILKKVNENTTHKATDINTLCIGMEKYNQLFESLSQTQLDEASLDRITEIMMLSPINIFEIKSIDDVNNYSSIKNSICKGILEDDGSVQLSDAIKEYDEKTRKKLALLELIYDIDIDRAKFLTNKYGSEIESLEGLTEQEEKFQKYIINIKTILNMDNPELFYKEFESQISSLSTMESNSSYEIQKQLIKMYERIYSGVLYNPKENPDDLVSQKEIYEDKEGNKHEIEVYEIKRDFYALARSEGAYDPKWKLPENFMDSVNIPNISYHGNCESLVAQDLMAFARSRGPIFGYANSNGLLLAAPYDIASTESNKKFDSANVEGMFASKIMGPEQMKDQTTHGHNEFSNERLYMDEKTGQLVKRKPDYVIWVDEELTDGLTEEEIRLKREKSEKWQITKQAASQLGVPIVVLNRERFLIQEQEDVDHLKKILSGEETDEKISKADAIRDMIIKYKNNNISCRFASSKINAKYFTQDGFHKLFEDIEEQLETLKTTDHEEYIKCSESLSNTCYDLISWNIPSNQNNIELFSNIAEKYKNNTQETEAPKLEEQDCEEIKTVLTELLDNGLYSGDNRHTKEHISKVMMFGTLIARNEEYSEEDVKLLMLASAFHDSGRVSDIDDFQHAERSAEVFKNYYLNRDEPMLGIKQEDIGVVQTIIAYHEAWEASTCQVDERIIRKYMNDYGVPESKLGTVMRLSGALKDADALDRLRFANDRATLDTRFLKTKTAKDGRVISWGVKINQEIARKKLELEGFVEEDEVSKKDLIEKEEKPISLLYKKRREKASKKDKRDFPFKPKTEIEEEKPRDTNIKLGEMFEMLGLNGKSKTEKKEVKHQAVDKDKMKDALFELYNSSNLRLEDFRKWKDFFSGKMKDGEEEEK